MSKQFWYLSFDIGNFIRHLKLGFSHFHFMFILIAKIVLLGSILGMFVIFFRKIPVLVDMPVQNREGDWKKRVAAKARIFTKVFIALSKRQLRSLRSFALQKINERLGKRDNAQDKHLQDDYWQQIRRGR